MSYCGYLLSVHPPSTPLNDFSETPGPIFFQLHVEPSVTVGLKICTNGHSPLIKMAVMPTYGKTLKIFPRTKKIMGWILVYSIEDSRSTKFIQMMTVDWPLTFFTAGQIYVPLHFIWRKYWKSFSQNDLKTNGWNLQCMIILLKLLVTIKILSPGGYLSLPLGYTHV